MRWWRQPDQFEWLSGYFQARGLAAPTRRLMALVSLALVGMPLGLLPTPVHHSPVSTVIVACSAAVGLGYATIWWRGWPSRRQSLTMIACGGLVAVATLLSAEPVQALMSSTGLVVLSAYLGFFHSIRAAVLSIAAALIIGGVLALRVAAVAPDTALASTGFWVLAEVCVALPLAIAVVVRTLGADVVRSDHDSLTGVLNRRAFYQRVVALLTAPSSALRLVVIVIDLDKFKKLNDTFGHYAGDQALTAVGWALRQANTATAIIGRAGGEEFIVVDCLSQQDAEALPERLRADIAALPHPITASVGAAIVAFNTATDPSASITRLVRTADAAMYYAKHNGGNQVHIRGLDPQGRK